MTTKPKKWWLVKGKIISKWGSVRAGANELDCSVESLRLAATNPRRVPNVAQKLEEALR